MLARATSAAPLSYLLQTKSVEADSGHLSEFVLWRKNTNGRCEAGS